MDDSIGLVPRRDIQLMSVANASVNFASGANGVATVTVLGSPQEGHIRACNLVLTNGSASTPGPVTITLANRLGKIVFSAVLQMIATAAVVPIWDFNGIDVEFDNGLFLTAQNGNGATYTGSLSLQAVWYQ